MKDEGQAWYQFAMHPSVTQQDIEMAKEAYMRFGAGPLKNRAAITPSNVFNKAMMFYYYQMSRSNRIRTMHIAQVLKRMLKSGKVREFHSFILITLSLPYPAM
jgi:hypothetical protein